VIESQSMYNPTEAKKSYSKLLKENGNISAFKSAGFVFFWYFVNEYVLGQTTPIAYLVIGFFLFCIYFTWKPKLRRFFRGHLRGKEYRDKAD
jgi:hypothetical protein